MCTDEERARIAEEAVGWMIRLQAATPEERLEFRAWLRRSKVHVEEYLRIANFPDEIKSALRGGGGSQLRSPNAISVADVPEPLQPGDAEQSNAEADTASLRGTRVCVNRWGWAAAAAAAVAAIILITASIFDPTTRRVIVTESEFEEITLPDESVVVAAPKTHLVAEYTKEQRRITLVEGRAMFYVASDAARPFYVSSALGTVRAVGTAFEARLEANRFRVHVTEGLVAVHRDAQESGSNTRPTRAHAVMLKAGEGLSVAAEGPLVPEEIDVEIVTAWKNRRLIFRHHTVGEAVHDFNRLNKVQIHVLDAALLQQQVSGAFAATDPESFVEYLKKLGDVEVMKGEDGTLFVVPKRANATIGRTTS